MKAANSRFAQVAWTTSALAGVIAAWLVLAAQWHSLPLQVPAHTDLFGHVDRYGSRWNLCIWPTAATVAFALLSLVERLPVGYNLPVAKGKPHRAECERLATAMIRSLNVAFCWTFAWFTLQWTIGAQSQASGGATLFRPLPMVFLPLGIAAVTLVRMERLAGQNESAS